MGKREEMLYVFVCIFQSLQSWFLRMGNFEKGLFLWRKSETCLYFCRYFPHHVKLSEDIYRKIFKKIHSEERRGIQNWSFVWPTSLCVMCFHRIITLERDGLAFRVTWGAGQVALNFAPTSVFFFSLKSFQKFCRAFCTDGVY